MRRAELYRVRHPSATDSRRARVFCIVSRQVLIDSAYATVICAPIYSAYDGLATQVELGTDDGMKQECAIHCDNLVSLDKRGLTDFVATLSAAKMERVDRALAVALGLPARAAAG